MAGNEPVPGGRRSSPRSVSVPLGNDTTSVPLGRSSLSLFPESGADRLHATVRQSARNRIEKAFVRIASGFVLPGVLAGQASRPLAAAGAPPDRFRRLAGLGR